jgi:malate dehydrogenase (oxaloacetate-decarboxylating)
VATLVAAGVEESVASGRLWLVDRDGLLHDRLDGLQSFQAPFVRPWVEVADLADQQGTVSLEAVMAAAAPHAIVGVTGHPGVFTEGAIRAMAAKVATPIVLPLSNPTPRAEATPADVVAWTDGRALVGTGSPFAPVVFGGVAHPVTQVNNLYLFPGLGRGVVAVGARFVSDGMLSAAAAAIGELVPLGGEPLLLPPLEDALEVSDAVALAVARCAVAEGHALARPDAAIMASVAACRWVPEYRALDFAGTL